MRDTNSLYALFQCTQLALVQFPAGTSLTRRSRIKNILSKRPAQDEEASQVLQNESGKAEQNRSGQTPASLPERNPAGLISLPAYSLPVLREAFHGLPR
jgi:hypothetical protein